MLIWAWSSGSRVADRWGRWLHCMDGGPDWLPKARSCREGLERLNTVAAFQGCPVNGTKRVFICAD